jgi:hypothetical protein
VADGGVELFAICVKEKKDQREPYGQYPVYVPLFTPAKLAVGLGLRANPIYSRWSRE